MARVMPHAERLPEIERLEGPAHTWLLEKIEQSSISRVAIRYGVNANAVRYWRNRITSGYIRVDGNWVLPETQGQAS